MKNHKKIVNLVLAAMFLALALVLPFLTMQIKSIGKSLCPMHIPVMLCGYFCGPLYGAVVGIIAPLLRFALFGMPVVMPTGIAMSFELATYGFVTGFLYKKLPYKKINIYISLIAAMLLGRVVWGLVSAVIIGIFGNGFGWKAFMTGAFLEALPGIAVQLILIPVLVMVLRKHNPQ